MRFYSIVITDPDTGQVVRRYDSQANGQNLPGALNIELDVPVVPFALPMGAAYVRVWGISLQEIGQSQDLNGKQVAVYAGMAKGLPLATAAFNDNQQGLIVQGFIFQAFGNWKGTDMTLDLIIQASLGTASDPRNLVINWKAGTPLGQAIDQTLAVAFPGYTRSVHVSPNLVLPNDEVGYYSSLIQFAQWVKQVSEGIVKTNYRGVDIVLREKAFTVYDSTTTVTPKTLKFQDLIGQPTWIESPLIQVTTVLRADLAVGDYIKLPPVLVTTTQQSFSQFRNSSVFQGSFQVVRLRHVGNFRQPDAASWSTSIDATPALQAS